MSDQAIIGAGPIGLEAALYARALGHRPTVYEKGAVVAANVERWDFVRLFSPWELNTSPLGLDALRSLGLESPPAGALHTGAEFRDRYLLPIAEFLEDDVSTSTEVVAVARCGLLKGEEIGSSERASRAFRLLVRDEDGAER